MVLWKSQELFLERSIKYGLVLGTLTQMVLKHQPSLSSTNSLVIDFVASWSEVAPWNQNWAGCQLGNLTIIISQIIHTFISWGLLAAAVSTARQDRSHSRNRRSEEHTWLFYINRTKCFKIFLLGHLPECYFHRFRSKPRELGSIMYHYKSWLLAWITLASALVAWEMHTGIFKVPSNSSSLNTKGFLL